VWGEEWHDGEDRDESGVLHGLASDVYTVWLWFGWLLIGMGRGRAAAAALAFDVAPSRSRLRMGSLKCALEY